MRMDEHYAGICVCMENGTEFSVTYERMKRLVNECSHLYSIKKANIATLFPRLNECKTHSESHKFGFVCCISMLKALGKCESD